MRSNQATSAAQRGQLATCALSEACSSGDNRPSNKSASRRNGMWEEKILIDLLQMAHLICSYRAIERLENTLELDAFQETAQFLQAASASGADAALGGA